MTTDNSTVLGASACGLLLLVPFELFSSVDDEIRRCSDVIIATESILSNTFELNVIYLKFIAKSLSTNELTTSAHAPMCTDARLHT